MGSFFREKIPPMGSFWQQGFAPQEKNTPYEQVFYAQHTPPYNGGAVILD